MQDGKIKYGQYYASTEIEELDLNGIDEIGESACASSSIKHIKGVVRNAGNFAFSVSEWLEGRIEVAGERVGRAAFERCPKIDEVVLDEDVKFIDGWAFDECESLTQLTLPQDLTTIGEEAFHKTGIKTLKIGKVGTIEANAFSECDKLESVTIQEITESIKSNAFSKCPALKSISYKGESLMTLAENERFKGITEQDGVFYIESEEVVLDENGRATIIPHKEPIELDVPFEFRPEELTDKPKTYKGVLKHSAKIVPEGILRECKTITGLELDNVEVIGNNAFDKCSNLASVQLSPNIRAMGRCAFQDSGIEKIDLSKTHLTAIEGRTFHVCRNLKSISLPDTLKKIGYFGIAGCTSLEELSLPDSITEIQKAGLARNLMLERVNIPKGLTSISEYCLMGCKSLKELTIPDNVKFIGDKAFSLSGMSTIRLPEGVGIVPSILDGCKSLRSITIGDKKVMDLDELGENLIFEGVKKSINGEDGQEQWYISYSDEKGNMHTQELSGVMSIEAKKAQIREQDVEKTKIQFDDIKTGTYCITEEQIGKATIHTPTDKKNEAKNQMKKDDPNIESIEKG
ncbi:MAG: leucine-rich repeat domain-containing protein [Clostridia bacterium]|nr:leucine-rich repeat domain-containing protein [Clostridia bacterium]MBR2785881.1 leucine-rich repeat domain-containing protein [Clostridia bacterium]